MLPEWVRRVEGSLGLDMENHLRTVSEFLHQWLKQFLLLLCSNSPPGSASASSVCLYGDVGGDRKLLPGLMTKLVWHTHIVQDRLSATSQVQCYMWRPEKCFKFGMSQNKDKCISKAWNHGRKLYWKK